MKRRWAKARATAGNKDAVGAAHSSVWPVSPVPPDAAALVIMQQTAAVSLALAVSFTLCAVAEPQESDKEGSDAPKAQQIETGFFTCTFKLRNKLGSVSSLMKRYGYRPNEHEEYEDYDIAEEKFYVYVPHDYSPRKKYGLLVWIGNSRDMELSEEWRAILDKHQMLWVGAERSGPSRLVWHRYGLAIDAATNMVKRYKINKKHIYVGGIGDGSKIAARIGVGLADMFRGVIAIGRVDFFRRVDVLSDPHMYYSASYTRPAGRTLGYARKRSRFVFVIETDLAPTSHIMSVIKNGFVRTQFRNTHIVEVDDAYAPPPSETFDHILDLLTGRK